MNALTRMPQAGVPIPGTRQGNWVWDGQQWICSPCDGNDIFPGCPPPGFPPAGCPPWFSGMNSPPWYPGANAGVSFGATAPLNPVRGHFWWNGLVLAIFDGAVWMNTATGTIVNGGTTPGPGPAPAPVATTTQMFAIGQGTTPSFTAATWTTLPWQSAPNIINGAWDAIQHKFTPNKPGYYLSSYFSFYNLPGAGNSGRAVQQNDDGSTLNHTFSISQVATSAAQNGWLASTDVVHMNGTTDYLRLWVYDTSGNASVSETVWNVFMLP